VNDELFPPSAVASLSPRLRWLRKHDVHTHYTPDFDQVTLAECPETGRDCYPWIAWLPDKEKPGEFGCGYTYEDALVDLAKRHGLALWNEETP